jgi:hypothetical protein
MASKGYTGEFSIRWKKIINCRMLDRGVVPNGNSSNFPSMPQLKFWPGCQTIQKI